MVDEYGFLYDVNWITHESKLGVSMFDKVVNSVKTLPVQMQYDRIADASFGSEELIIWLSQRRLTRNTHA